MKDEILTDRLRLRIVELSDVENLYKLRTNLEVSEFIIRDIDESLEDIENSIEGWREDYLFYTISTLESNEFAGTICLWNINHEEKYAEIGYELLPGFQNKGIMTNAIYGVLNYAFNNLDFEIIEAFTHVENVNSRKLLIKTGFSLVENRVDEGNLNNVIYRMKKSR